ncbi:hypothetical protein Q1W73_00820 [Asticcacaulis sp. ZE23SCel15]|uniref:hypothetical protein n=1 Tax=Asticcacaulis sp. ZE23SCel15 TaxID=3059027 RepID=UPI0026602200|nr:hypothetical protein [Asticcacaulis sp. ZE23SCel15]WKL57560.1 hypothetical protein Q1W73_00820 [Asticcacaulis sp. ZE23SCel15]
MAAWVNAKAPINGMDYQGRFQPEMVNKDFLRDTLNPNATADSQPVTANAEFKITTFGYIYISDQN